MKKYKLLALGSIALGAFLLTGCRPNTVPTAKPSDIGISPEQKQCAARCLTQQTRCNKQSTKLYQQCKANAQQQAKQQFALYAAQQKKAGNSINKHESNFLNLSHCHQPLNCKTDYQACYSNCGL